MSKDNDAFFNARRASAAHVYSGIGVSVGSSSDWIPDLIEIIVAESSICTLRLIELEARESDARISSRKYLPESSEKIVSIFQEYIERLIRDCRSRADSRENEFDRLKATLSKAEKIFVTTACALRTSLNFVEELPLIDQPTGLVQKQIISKICHEETPNFNGTMKLSGEKSAALGRAILVLDAIIRQCDHSDATFKTWRAQDRSQPLKKLLKNKGSVYPSLHGFISRKRISGTTLDFEKAISELVGIWSENANSNLNQEYVRSLVNRYFSIAVKIKATDRMNFIFEAARRFLEKDLCLIRG